MMRRTCAALLIAGALLAVASAQTTLTKASEIHQMYISDQADRGVAMEGTKPTEVTDEQMSANDAARRTRAHQLA
jgi:hypothetical protein